MKLITNSQTENVKNYLLRLAESADTVEIVSPFFTDHETVHFLIAKNIAVSLTTSLRFPTSPESLKSIHSSAEVKFNTEGLHSKIYLFVKKGIPFASVVGSSNLTDYGLSKNIEANIAVTDEKTLNQIQNEITSIKDRSFHLEPRDIATYQKHYENQRTLSEKFVLDEKEHKTKRRSNITVRKTSITADAYRYLEFWKFADEVCDLVSDISKAEWPDVPTYLAVDHFWHWIKVVWQDQAEEYQNRNASWRKSNVPDLFRQYARWDKSNNNFTRDNPYRSKKFQSYLGIENIGSLTKTQAREMYSLLNSSQMRMKRFKGDEIFVDANPIEKIREALHYLLYSEDEIVMRISKLTAKKGPFKLNGLGDSNVQEIIGWVHCHTMPIRNQKADDAVALLGYRFRK